MERPKTIGVFAGLLTSDGKIRLQRRIEKDSLIPGKTFEGDYELPGGRVGEKDLKKALTLEVLQRELVLRVKSDLGITIITHPNPPLYLAVLEDAARGICDWAFAMPVPPPPAYWDENAPTTRKTIDVSPFELYELAQQPKGQQLLSGWGKRMCRMGLAAFLCSQNVAYCSEAKEYLYQVKPDWEKEGLSDPVWSLGQLRKELGLE